MTQKKFSARLPLIVGFAAVALLLGGVGAWSVGTQIAGAVVVRGLVKVESDRQVVQHPDGGVVGEILARDGDVVQAGDVLIRLDGVYLQSELAIVERQLTEIFARRVRLVAERDDADALEFDALPDFSMISSKIAQDQIDGQRRLFEARRASMAQKTQQLTEQQAQIERQIDGVQAQITSTERQLALIAKELADVQSLFDRGLSKAARVLELQREQARLEGEMGRLVSAVAEAKTRISGLAIEIVGLADLRREESISRLRDLLYSEIELEERRVSLTERLARLDVRAPVSGTVFGSRIFAVQSVIQSADPILFLVPSDQPLQISVRVAPIDIEQVFPGQNVAIAFTSFNRRTTPEVPGTVVRVAADADVDEATGQAFYEAILLPDPEALAAIEDITLLPGMPVEAFLRTEDRTPLAYLVQPLSVYFNRAFREE
jgi:HlyD family secretion protein